MDLALAKDFTYLSKFGVFFIKNNLKFLNEFQS